LECSHDFNCNCTCCADGKKISSSIFYFVVAWALWGIYNEQGPAAPILAKLTALGIGVLISTVLFTLIYKLRKNKMA